MWWESLGDQAKESLYLHACAPCEIAGYPNAQVLVMINLFNGSSYHWVGRIEIWERRLWVFLEISINLALIVRWLALIQLQILSISCWKALVSLAKHYFVTSIRHDSRLVSYMSFSQAYPPLISTHIQISYLSQSLHPSLDILGHFWLYFTHNVMYIIAISIINHYPIHILDTTYYIKSVLGRVHNLCMLVLRLCCEMVASQHLVDTRQML